MNSPRLFCALLASCLLAAARARAQTTLYTENGATSSAQLGSSVDGVGDVNHDGFDDVIIGSPLDDSAATNAGSVRVISGKTGAPIHSILGTQSGAEFGGSVAGAGDVNNDGWVDFVVGEPGFDGAQSNQGRAIVYSGKTGLSLFWVTTTEASARCGHSVAAAGDVDNDGWDDVAVGAPFGDVIHPLSSATMTDAGWVKVYSGKTHAVLQSHSSLSIWTHPDASYDLFGWSIDLAGDIDGDNRLDLIVGAPQFDPDDTLSNAGAAMTYSGQTGWLLGWHEGTQTSAQLGYSVAGAGDVDHDGHDDLLVGEPYWDGNYTDSGRAHLFSGSLGSAIFVKLGGGSVRFGASVAGVGDVNGDTYDDFLVGAPSFDGFLGGLIDCGEAQVFSGFSGLILHSFFGAASGDALGRAVGAAGDVNDDGRGDLVIGEPTADPNGSASGRARIVLMDAPFPSTYCTAKTNSQGCVPKIGFSGAPSASVGDNFVVNASQVIAQKSYFLFWGFSTTAAPFGGGTMCVHVPRLRTPLQLSGGNPNVACNGFQWFYFSHAYMAAHGLNAGDTVYAQFWSRDPGFAAPGNIGLTNALKFEIVP